MRSPGVFLTPALGGALVACVLTLVAGISLTVASGQEGGAFQISAAQHDPAGTVLVTLTGLGVSGLTAQEVSATIAGADVGAATSVEVDAGSASTSVVLAFETSSSMLFGLMEQAQVAGLGMTDGLGPSDRVAVVAFADEARVISDFTTDRAETRAAIESLSLGSSAGVYAGVDTAARLFDESGSGGKALVILGWGWEFGVATTVGRAESVATAKQSGAAVFWVPFGLDHDGPYFDDLTTGTGGRILTPAEIDLLGQELAATALESQSFRFETPVLPAGPHPLIVTAGGETIATSLEITNDGLIRAGSITQAAAEEPFVIAVDSLEPLSTFEIEATSGGRSLPVDPRSGEVRVDPWAFEPGALDVRVTAKVDGRLAATETVSLEIAALQPQILVEPAEASAAPTIDVSWRAQGGSGLTLLISIDGEVVHRTEETRVTVPVPDGGAVEASLVSADGATVGFWTGVVDPRSEGEVAGVGSDAPWFGGSPGLLAMAAATAVAVFLLARWARESVRSSVFLLARWTRESVRPSVFLLARWARESVRPSVRAGGTAGDDSRGSVPEPLDDGPTVTTLPVSVPERLESRDQGDSAFSPRRPRGAVVVRTPRGSEVRVPIREGQLSVGASAACDITLVGEGVRVVHLILAATGEFTYRVLPFGRVSLVEDGEEVGDDTVITVREWLAVGDHLISVEHW